MFIPNVELDFSHPGFRGQKSTGSRFWIRNTGGEVRIMVQNRFQNRIRIWIGIWNRIRNRIRIWIGTPKMLGPDPRKQWIQIRDTNQGLFQCCGSGMFIPDPDFFYPGSKNNKKRREEKINCLTFHIRKVTLYLESGLIRQDQTVPDPDLEHIMYGVRLYRWSCMEYYCTGGHIRSTAVQVEEIYDLQREPLVENKTCYGAIFLFR